MKGLWRKEFRELRPFLLLGAFLLLLDVLEWFTGPFAMQSLAANFGDSGEVLAVLLFLIAFAAGSGLLVRELDDRTLTFLDGLPVTRLRVFSVKVGVASVVLLLYPAGHLLMLGLQHLVSRQSLDHAVHVHLLWQAGAMACVVTWIGLCMGLLLGFLRSLCWLTLGLCAVVVAAVTRAWPEFSVLNPMKLLDIKLVGLHWRISPEFLATQLGVLVVCLLLSGSIFISTSTGSGRKLQLRLSRPLVSAAVTIATIGMAIGALALIGSNSGPTKRPGGTGMSAADFEASPVASARSERYSFTYESLQAAQATALLREADAIYDKVAAMLGVETGGARIDVDLSGSVQNTEGTAFHDRIRMHMGLTPLETLAHETTHVLAHRLAGGELDREFSKMDVLNEGLASWVQNTVAHGSGTTESGRFQAAIVSRRHLLKPEQLTDIGSLARHADINLRYPLGAALIDAMVTRYGPAAPGKLLRALSDKDFPRNLAGVELWSAAFQAAGFDLSLVFDDYSRQLQAWEVEFADRIEALPRPRGSLVQGNGLVGVDLRWDGQLPEGWEAIVRYRPEEDSPLDQYRSMRIDEHGVAWMPEAAAINSQLCFQPGVRTETAAIFEEWVCLPLD